MDTLFENNYKTEHSFCGHVTVIGINNDIEVNIEDVFWENKREYSLCVWFKERKFDDAEYEYEDKNLVYRKSLRGALKYIKENLK